MQSELDDVDGRDVGSRYRWIYFPWSFMEIMGINMMVWARKPLSEDRGSGVEVAAAMVISDIRGVKKNDNVFAI